MIMIIIISMICIYIYIIVSDMSNKTWLSQKTAWITPQKMGTDESADLVQERRHG